MMNLKYSNSEELFCLCLFCDCKIQNNDYLVVPFVKSILENLKLKLYKKWIDQRFKDFQTKPRTIKIQPYEAAALYFNCSILKLNDYQNMVYIKNILPLHQILISTNNFKNLS